MEFHIKKLIMALHTSILIYIYINICTYNIMLSYWLAYLLCKTSVINTSKTLYVIY